MQGESDSSQRPIEFLHSRIAIEHEVRALSQRNVALARKPSAYNASKLRIPRPLMQRQLPRETGMTISRRDALLGTLSLVPALAAGRVCGAAGGAAAPPWALPAKRAVQVIENTWIPMPDGARLAARLWIPEGAESSPVPVVFEYIPYRMRDAYRSRDDRWGPQLAQY